MNLPRLYAVVDQRTAARYGWEICELAHAYLRGGVRLLQVRAPDATGGELLSWCDRIVADASDVGAHVIVNDRLDIALLAGAAGVHLGQSDLPADAVRPHVSATTLVGLSTHTRQQLDESTEVPVDYVAVGPIYGTGTKVTCYPEVGLDLVAYAARLFPARPVVAIGGITLERAAATIASGAASVAVVSDLVSRGDPERRVADYLRVLDAPSK